MALTDTAIRTAKPKEKSHIDSGGPSAHCTEVIRE